MRKARSIPLSPEHGVNPTIPVCFWCGKDKNEIALLGRIGGKEDREAPSRMVLDYEPCEDCRRGMARGFTIMEATNDPNAVTSAPIQKGAYPTGRFVVLKDDAAEKIFSASVVAKRKCFVDPELFAHLFCTE